MITVNILEVTAQYTYLTVPFSSPITITLVGLWAGFAVAVLILRVIKLFPMA